MRNGMWPLLIMAALAGLALFTPMRVDAGPTGRTHHRRFATVQYRGGHHRSHRTVGYRRGHHYGQVRGRHYSHLRGGHYGHSYRRHGFYPYGHGYRSSYYGYSDYGGYSSYHGDYSDQGTIRIEGEPKKHRDRTRVLVNGHEAGTVDDYDGFSQRLYLPPGEYKIELQLDGHQPLAQRLFVTSNRTYKIRYELMPQAPGVEEEEESVEVTPGHGAVQLRVKPLHASVYVNGAHAGQVDEFDGGKRGIQLAPGEYELELRLEGYRTYRKRIYVVPGHTYEIRHQLEPSPRPEVTPAPDRSVGG